MELTIHERLMLSMVLASHRFQDIKKGIATFEFIKSIMPNQEEMTEHDIKFLDNNRVEFNVKEGTQPREFVVPEALEDLYEIIDSIYKTKGILASEAVVIEPLMEKLSKLSK